MKGEAKSQSSSPLHTNVCAPSARTPWNAVIAALTRRQIWVKSVAFANVDLRGGWREAGTPNDASFSGASEQVLTSLWATNQPSFTQPRKQGLLQRGRDMEMLLHNATQPIMWHLTLIRHSQSAASVWNIEWVQLGEGVQAWKYTAHVLHWDFSLLINVAFCLCEPVRIRLVFHSTDGLYTHTLTPSLTRARAQGYTSAAVCGTNSFCHKWPEIGSVQSPITSHLG